MDPLDNLTTIGCERCGTTVLDRDELTTGRGATKKVERALTAIHEAQQGGATVVRIEEIRAVLEGRSWTVGRPRR